MKETFLNAFPLLFIMPFALTTGEIGTSWLVVLAVVLFFSELAFFLVPGVSLSSLLIGMSCIYIGFVPTLIASAFAINIAHFILRRDISMFIANLLTLLPLIGFGAFYGTWMVESFGWGIYGVSIGLVKWGISIPVGYLLGRNMAKRFRDFFLEPTINFFIFLKLHGLFMFLF